MLIKNVEKNRSSRKRKLLSRLVSDTRKEIRDFLLFYVMKMYAVEILLLGFGKMSLIKL